MPKPKPSKPPSELTATVRIEVLDCAPQLFGLGSGPDGRGGRFELRADLTSKQVCLSQAGKPTLVLALGELVRALLEARDGPG
jgi:hypothetical protein